MNKLMAAIGSGIELGYFAFVTIMLGDMLRDGWAEAGLFWAFICLFVWWLFTSWTWPTVLSSISLLLPEPKDGGES